MDKPHPHRRVLARDPESVERAGLAITLVEEGLTIRRALERCGLKRSMFMGALASAPGLASRYSRALEFSADFLVDEALEAGRHEPDVQRARVISETTRWAASKRNSKRYGDRLDLQVTTQLDITTALMEARQRLALRPISDQSRLPDPQVIDVTPEPAVPASDNKSEPITPDEEIDIFS
jgi:hypothetical protein